jgi:hypothetical protein
MTKDEQDLSQNPPQGEIDGEVENKINTTSPVPSFPIQSQFSQSDSLVGRPNLISILPLGQIPLSS